MEKQNKDSNVLVECPDKDWGDVDKIGCWEDCELYERGDCNNGFVAKELFVEVIRGDL